MLHRILGVCLLLALISTPSFADDDDGFKLNDSDARERHEEQAEKIKKEYQTKRMLKMRMRDIQNAQRFTIGELKATGQPAGEVIAAIIAETRKQDPNGKGLNVAFACDKDRLKTPINLTMRDVPVPDLLRYIGMAANLGYEYEEHAVVVKNAEDAETTDLKKLQAMYLQAEE